MTPGSQGAAETRNLGKPADWDPAKQGECGFLSIADARDERGNWVMISRWHPQPGELERLQAGAPLLLTVHGRVHPPVNLVVGMPEDGEAQHG